MKPTAASIAKAYKKAGASVQVVQSAFGLFTIATNSAWLKSMRLGGMSDNTKEAETQCRQWQAALAAHILGADDVTARMCHTLAADSNDFSTVFSMASK